VIPASIVEIDHSAFSHAVWKSIAYEGRHLYAVNEFFICSVDWRVLFGSHSLDNSFISSVDSDVSGVDELPLRIPPEIEAIGANAFRKRRICGVIFLGGSILREIGPGAFAKCKLLEVLKLPESVEILGDRCFESCAQVRTVKFEGSSRLKKIGERAFAGCNLHSITIPASTEEIDGSAFVDCPIMTIRVAPGSQNFRIEGSLLVTSDGTEIVRHFGRDREIVVGRKVKVLRKSCFEGCKFLDRVSFEAGSELERIGHAALRDCTSLFGIDIPPSVDIIGDSAFEGCSEIESFSIAPNPVLGRIGVRAFAKCVTLRSFSIPRLVGEIGNNCFTECDYLYGLSFGSSESLKRVVNDRSLDDALERFGVSARSTLFRIEVESGAELQFSGWAGNCQRDGGGSLHLTLVRDIQ
jgi:hypothetical protein